MLFEKYHLNNCDSHVDFMIGTKDLKIIGITEENQEVPILIDGNFPQEFN
ncbi:MAG TPA: aminopeptidase [Candidatus Faecimonas gallistercoris]|nr:aminopeptidase [Candidatus Faecimonas gallistercoris]